MNMLPSKCNWCACLTQVNQADWADPDAHLCIACAAGIQSLTSSVGVVDEFALLDDETDLTFTDLDGEEFLYETAPKLTASGCECGATRARSPWHARWCPIFKDPMDGKRERK